MPIFDHPEFHGHERLIHVSDGRLRAIIAIHDRTLGPAIGGCRLFPYASEQAALTDVLRLSRGMTYKNALAGLPFGGGKSVIIADPTDKNPALLAAYGRALKALNGEYWTGEDINIGPDDIEEIARHAPYVLGRTSGASASGDPSRFTAGGCFAAMKAALMHVFGTPSLAGRTVAIQGLGSVGTVLATRIVEGGGALIVTDVRRDAVQSAAASLGARAVEPHAIYDAQCDVFAPCAMGGTLNEDTINRLRARIVCGVANNQLTLAADGKRLLERGITYAPDYVVNAGGIINASGEFLGDYDEAVAWRKIEAIGATTARILAEAERQQRPPPEIADDMAEAMIASRRAARHAGG